MRGGVRLGRRWWIVVGAAATAGALLVTLVVLAGGRNDAPSARSASTPAAGDCPGTRLAGPTTTTPARPTTVSTIEQAYRCILGVYHGGARLDHRVLLASGFAAFTQALQRRGVDRPAATLPPFTGDRDRDRVAFRDAYLRATGELPADPALAQELAATTVAAMVASLDDNHATWVRPVRPDGVGPEQAYGLGLTLSGMQSSHPDPTAVAPLFVTSVVEGAPAARHGVRPGDIVVAVDDVAPFVDGAAVRPVWARLTPRYPDDSAVRLTLQRPADGTTRGVTLAPAWYRAVPDGVTTRRPAGDIGYVRLVGTFAPGTADRILAAVGELRATGDLRGLVLDLRGVNGGAPPEVLRLLGAFGHGLVTSHDCDGADRCTAHRTDDSIGELGLRLAVLTDRSCASGCEDFVAAVRAHHLGTLVGTRTAGGVSGPASRFRLDDDSVLGLPMTYHLGPDRARVDRIGVPPDRSVPVTPADLSTGRDPVVDVAVRELSP